MGLPDPPYRAMGLPDPPYRAMGLPVPLYRAMGLPVPSTGLEVSAVLEIVFEAAVNPVAS